MFDSESRTTDSEIRILKLPKLRHVLLTLTIRSPKILLTVPIWKRVRRFLFRVAGRI